MKAALLVLSSGQYQHVALSMMHSAIKKIKQVLGFDAQTKYCTRAAGSGCCAPSTFHLSVFDEMHAQLSHFSLPMWSWMPIHGSIMKLDMNWHSKIHTCRLKCDNCAKICHCSLMLRLQSSICVSLGTQTDNGHKAQQFHKGIKHKVHQRLQILA